MPPRSKRAKTSTAPTLPNDGANAASTSTDPQTSYIPFQTGPTLARIPDDILLEILSHLPTLHDGHVLFGGQCVPPVIASDKLVRTPTLRALSRTCRVLRARCLDRAWQSVELCAASLPLHDASFYRAIGEATKAATRVLETCPHLLPLIQTVTVVLTRYQSAEIIPAFAACLATLPNLVTIQVVHAHTQMTTAIKNGFHGKRFPSVRRISLPCSAHEIIKCCPNLEEVTCTDGVGSTIAGSIIKGKCHQVRVLKNVSALARLAKVLPNLRHIGARGENRFGWRAVITNEIAKDWDRAVLATFRRLDTIELLVHEKLPYEKSLGELTADEVKEASAILKKNASQAEKKTVVLTSWRRIEEPKQQEWTHSSELYMVREVIQV